MSDLHLCTTKSLRAGIHLPAMECPYCKHETLYHDWVASRCDTCGHDTDRYTCHAMMAIRENMGLSRKELSGLIGYRPSTIKNYEFCNPSRAYWLKFKSFVKDFYSGNETASN